jgi:ADP-ribose pyrophosphatase YjhB (NUDIX family)
MLDATVGGHLRAGEGVAEALREVEEEIGVATTPDALRRLGTRRAVNEAEEGVRDRELQEVFLLRDDRPLTGYRPHPAELAALVRLPLPALLAFFSGEANVVAGQAIAPGDAAPCAVALTADDFIPSIDRYFYRVTIAAAAALRGERHVAV